MSIDFVSIISSLLSIFLALYAIHFAKKESENSKENYTKTRELLNQIEHKEDQIDRGIQFAQSYLFEIINKLLNQEGSKPISMQPISLDEIDAIVERKTVSAEKRIKELEDTMDRIPRIFIQEDEPSAMKSGDLWFKTKS